MGPSESQGVSEQRAPNKPTPAAFDGKRSEKKISEALAGEVREAFLHAWSGYKRFLPDFQEISERPLGNPLVPLRGLRLKGI